MRRMILGFTPNWFTVGMGTGILALDAYLMPGAPDWLRSVGTVFWLANMGVVAGLIVLMSLRSLIDRRGVREIFTHPVQSMFFGAIPMAMTTVVNGFFDIAPRYLGSASYHVGAILWVINALVVLGSVFVIPFLMFVSHDHALSGMSGVWLMPIVPAEVVAASSALLLPHVANIALRQDLFVGTIVLWAFSVPMAFLVLGMLFLRMVVHKLPAKDLAISIWITLGTLGTGIMGLMLVAKDGPLVVPQLASGLAGAATFAAVVFWGLGLWWLVVSFMVTGYYVWRRLLSFNLGWWGLTFPLGVYTAGTYLLDQALGSSIFSWAARGFFSLLAAFWVMVAILTVHHLVRLALVRPVSKRQPALGAVVDAS